MSTATDNRIDTENPVVLTKNGPDEVQINYHLPRGASDLSLAIKNGIEQVERLADVVYDKANAKAIADKGQEGLGKPGRIRREGSRVDTGRHVVDNLCGMRADLRVGLTNAGYGLVRTGWFQKPDGKIVVRLIFRRDAPTADILNLGKGKLHIAIRELATRSWQFCHVYDNPPMNPKNDERNATINLVGPQPADKEPTYEMYISDRTLQVRDLKAT